MNIILESMNIRDLYVGRYKDSGEEALFYQKSLMKYEDLIHGNREVYRSEINLDSLISYQDAIPKSGIRIAKNVSLYLDNRNEIIRKKAVELYLDDREKSIPLDRLFIGDIYRVDHIVESKILNSENQGLMSGDCYTTFTGVLIKQGALLINEDECLKDMEHAITVKRNHYPEEGNLVVIEDEQLRLMSDSKTPTQKIEPFTSIVPMKGKDAPKSKILSEYRKYMI